jgi:hypothetical protein
MGQYYMAVNIDNGESMSPHAYGNNGAKLMEHSYVNNDFTCAVKQLLSPGGQWHKARILWAGDYGDLKFSDFSKDKDSPVVKLADELSGGANVYCELQSNKELTAVKPVSGIIKDLILVNHTKKVCMKYRDIKEIDGWAIDPLPLLTSDGNGRGGGDYSGSFVEACGTWAGDSISIETEVPAGYDVQRISFVEGRNR